MWLNLVPGLGGFARLAGVIGLAKALEMVVLGDLVSAEEALRLNLVNRVFPKDAFADHVASFVKALLLADRRVVREILGLAAHLAPAAEEDNVRRGMESFARLARSFKQPEPSSP